MQAGWSVELGHDDPTLAIPWSSQDGRLRYYNLKQQPELLLNIVETYENRELAEFLAEVNSSRSAFQTAKCSVWTSDLMEIDDEVFAAQRKCCSYVDVVICDQRMQRDFAKNETLLQQISSLLGRVPEIPAAAEFIMRRCYFDPGKPHAAHGFYFTFYLSGYGDDEQTARQRWAIALKVVQNALLQISVGM